MQIHIPGEYKDNILFCLLYMGMGDWKEPNYRGNQVMMVMWHATAMIDRVLMHIVRVKQPLDLLIFSG